MAALLGAAVALVVTAAIEPFLIPWLTGLRVLDVPGYRSSHELPTVRGGGIAVIAGIVIGFFSARPPTGSLIFALAVLWFGLLGLMEDVHGLPVVSRLALQVVLTLAIVGALAHTAGLSPVSAAVTLVFGSVFMLGYVNAYNFMDGVNGLSALQAIVVGVAFSLLANHIGLQSVRDFALCIAGAGAGFLPYNAPTARVFMGDCGSYALGGGLAASAVALAAAGLPIEAVLAPAALYLTDSGTTLLRRIRAGEPWYLPHRAHTYQRLTDVGLSHFQVAGFTALLTATLACLGAVSLTSSSPGRVAADCVGGLLLFAYMKSPTWLASLLPASKDAQKPVNGANAQP